MQDEELHALIESSPLIHFGSSLKIYDKLNRLVHPTPNRLQEKISEAYETLMALGVPVRLIILKPRQVGCSTFCLEVVYHHGRRHKSDVLIVANVKPNSAALLTRLQDYQRMDDYPWDTAMSAQAQKISMSNGTRFEIDTAENYNAGISRTRQIYFASEVGKWPRTGVKNDKRVMEAVLQSVPDQGGTVAIAESTPEGANGWFYDTYQGALPLETFVAQIKAGVAKPGNGWVKVFASWFEFPEYQMRRLSDGERAHIERTLNSREVEGRTRYGWTAEQIAWRRSTIAEKCSASDDVFDEYYPEDDVRCFLVSGRPRFNLGVLSEMERAARGALPETGYLTSQEDRQVSWSPSIEGFGDIQVWERPRPYLRYLVSVDPATGVDQTENNNPDRHSITVWRAPYADEFGNERPVKLAARVRPPFQGESDLVASHISHLSRFYGNAIVVLEINMGLHILELLKMSGVPLYKREVTDDVERSIPRVLYGFKLRDRNMKRALMECLATHIRERQIEIACPHMIAELKSYIVDSHGAETAPAGKHDDDVSCAAMGVYSIASATLFVERRRKRQQPRDRRDWKRHVYREH